MIYCLTPHFPGCMFISFPGAPRFSLWSHRPYRSSSPQRADFSLAQICISRFFLDHTQAVYALEPNDVIVTFFPLYLPTALSFFFFHLDLSSSRSRCIFVSPTCHFGMFIGRVLTVFCTSFIFQCPWERRHSSPLLSSPPSPLLTLLTPQVRRDFPPSFLPIH